MQPVHPAGLLLTGGASRRMGSDKATLRFGGEPLAARAARALEAVAYPVLVVGHAAGMHLEVITDPGEGPLVALVRGSDALPREQTVLLVACDMPFVSADVLRSLSERIGDADAVLPVLLGRDQPLCACYAPRALDVARDLVEQGARAMHELIAAIDPVRIDGSAWSRELSDVDTPEDYSAILDAPE